MKSNAFRERMYGIRTCVTMLLPAIVSLAASGVWATESAKPGTTAITNVRIFDGEKVIPSGAVIIMDGKIAAFGAEVAFPDDAEVIDGRGKTLLPGLIDSHVPPPS